MKKNRPHVRHRGNNVVKEIPHSKPALVFKEKDKNGRVRKYSIIHISFFIIILYFSIQVLRSQI